MGQFTNGRLRKKNYPLCCLEFVIHSEFRGEKKIGISVLKFFNSADSHVFGQEIPK